jgi:hypothetical protein
LEVVCLDTPLARGRLGEKKLEHAPGNPDDAVVFADLDLELHRLPLGVPACILGEGEEHGRLSSFVALLQNVH